MSEIPVIFDTALHRRRRERFARLDPSTRKDASFLFRETANRLADRLLDVDRRFPRALDLGCRTGETATAVTISNPDKIGAWVHADISAAMVDLACTAASANGVTSSGAASSGVVMDVGQFAFQEQSFDLVVSNLVLHWVNDPLGALVQANRALKPDGLFQAALLGGETLTELRSCLMDAELEISGGASPRVSPMIALRDAGHLMQRAGFALPVIDIETIDVTYDNAFRLMADLRAMGETNAVVERTKRFSTRSLFHRAAALYQERHAGPDNRIVARFDVIFLHGWRPHQAQPKPLQPGSAESRLADALGTEETAVRDFPKRDSE